jgi:beta-glucosidase
VPRPVKELKGFDKVWLNPGETRKVTLSLDASSFAFYDIKTKSWVVEPGEFEVLVGRSSGDIRLKASFSG